MSGLSFEVYDGYFGSPDNVNWFDSNTPIHQGIGINNFTNLSTSTNNTVVRQQNFSVQWVGYFKPKETGNYTFKLTSDDASYFWLGDNAITGYTIANATIKNGGTHPPVSISSSEINLNADTYYSVRIQYGQSGGGVEFSFAFNFNNTSFQYSSTDYFYSTNIFPTINSVVAGTADYTIDISGTKFLDVTSVTVNDNVIINRLTDITINDNTSITATLPDLVEVSKVVVTNSSGGSSSEFNLSQPFYPRSEPTINSVVEGTEDYTIDITGTDLLNVTSVTVNDNVIINLLTDFTINDNTSITATLPDLVEVSKVAVTNSSGGSSSEFNLSPPFYPRSEPTINSVVEGTEDYTIVITGTDLLNVTSVTVNGVVNIDPPNITINNDTSITATLPDLVEVSKVAVTNSSGGSSSEFNLTQPFYPRSDPIITNVKVGTEDYTIDITGTNFLNVTSVTVNDTNIPLNLAKEFNNSVTFVIIDNENIVATVNDSDSFVNVAVSFVYVTNSYGDSSNTIEEIPPIYPICFPAGTPVLTDQGIVPIEKTSPKVHTINNKQIVAVTRTITNEHTLVCIEKNALGKNVPNEDTIISRCHSILYNGKMIPARHLIKIVKNKKKVYKIKYNGEILYNILMEKHEKMNVNNMIVETLHPENKIAKLYSNNYSERVKRNIIVQINNCMKRNEFNKCQTICDKMK